ncbi:MAG: Spy/CpxP family protein refolding chaperone [Beijerinckiaceae bacterium]|nr:Spy/CpxP family protein refolding chaperone [Beijerinckiaceae bacterium]MCI0736150.1 Spy/CpxP family protein refolding chaperone [Beijerinckiaceae bacterium]
MKPGLPMALMMAAIIGFAAALIPLSSRAEPAPAPARGEKLVFSDADRAAFLDARIAALHAGLKLTPEQEKLWPAVETALREAGKSALDRYQKFKNESAAASLVERLRRQGQNAVARGKSLEAIADAAAPLYASLSEDQKHRLPVLMRGLRPHLFHRHFAMMSEGSDSWRWRRGHWDEPEGFGQDGPGPPGARDR